MGEKKLYKSQKDRKLSGVCAGLGEYLGLDATLIRLCWVLGTLFTAGCVGVIGYIVCVAVIPEKPVNEIEG